MPENTRLKENRAESRRQAEVINKLGQDTFKLGQGTLVEFGRIDNQFEHLESRFDRPEE